MGFGGMKERSVGGEGAFVYSAILHILNRGVSGLDSVFLEAI